MSNKLKNKRGLSLRTKWTVIMSVFILVTFILFSVLFYKNTSEVVMIEGRNRLEATVNDLNSQLSKLNEPLTKQNVNKIFEKAINDNKHENYLISNIAQREIYIYIYDLNNRLLFKNRSKKENLAVNSSIDKPVFEKVKGVPGYACKQVIYSNKTGQMIGYFKIFYELSDLYKIKKEIFRHLFIFMLVWIIIVCIFEVIISNHFIKPIRDLSQTIEDIKDDPMATKRVPLPKTHDEIWRLTNLFNTALDKMQHYLEQQDQFVSDVSHELRTPVAIIEGHLNLLQRWGKDDPEVLEESLKTSVQEVERMKELIQEMLELSRLEQSDIQHFKEISKAKEVIMQVVNNFQMIHPDFTFILDNNLAEEVEIAMYRNHLEQLLIILLDNAVKYSKEEQKVVHIFVTKNTKNLMIAVEDYGEGISKEDLAKIFDRFYRVDKARSRERGGNGLGLAIAHKLIEIYKGKLTVDSVLDEGTTFKIELPLALNDKK